MVGRVQVIRGGSVSKLVGVFVARMQPIHNAHIWLMKQALQENDKLLIVLGSANKVDMLRNPFSFELRTDLLDSVISRDGELINRSDDIKVINLPDWSMENKTEDSRIWGDYLYYNIVSRIGQKSFSIYFSDEPAIIKSWFSDNLLNNYITLRQFEKTLI